MLDKRLKSRRFAREVLIEAMEDDDPHVLMMAIRDVMRAQGMSVEQVAQDAGLNAKSLLRALNGERSPNFATARAILNAIGYALSISHRKTKRKVAAG
ncbi:hypothetical protein MNBD_NITROSPINAE02-23 [hydrothermal vent metagenome]|uniref:HTH cro/C1-type domain-containing protein n=1 Tax=hydrothermal vent metagenome TaxID=652676 RepID=A0A3B1CD65_9ZZZZ